MSTVNLSQKAVLKELKDFSKDIVSSLGVLMASKEQGLVHAPFALLPSPVPQRCFEEALKLQTGFQAVVCKVAHDHDFLQQCLHNVIKVDDFTARLWEIYDTVYKEGLINPTFLSLMRIDYMFHTPPVEDAKEAEDAIPCSDSKPPQGPSPLHLRHLSPSYHHLPSSTTLKQIELNTIAASFAGLSQALTSYYRLGLRDSFSSDFSDKIPENRACDGLAEGLVAGWKAYDNEDAMIVFLVSEEERNIHDQRHLELCVLRLCARVRVFRCLQQHFIRAARVDEARRLFVDNREVALVYLRTWYTPQAVEGLWECRLMMERSRAIMCPSVACQLAGTKKVQQVLAAEGVLERFVGDKCTAEQLKRVFAAQYSLDQTQEGESAIETALKKPSDYVIKPQREGGGNNYYDEEVRTLLQQIRSSQERQAYVMMDRIHPLVVRNLPILPARKQEEKEEEEEEFVSMVSELGVYGYLLSTGDRVLENKTTGHLLRTKRLGVNEGGVATGFSVLDAPYLVA